MASQQAGGSNKVEDGVGRVRSSVDGNFSGNTGNNNVIGHGNTIYSIQMPPNIANPGGSNQWQGMGPRDRESREASRPYWMVPYCRNGAFTGRGNIIETIKEVCTGGAHNRVALHGLGGCGKTQIALEYVYRRFIEGHCDVFWVQGSGILKFTEGFKAIAQHVRIPLAGTEKDDEELLRRTTTWLEGPDSGDWILVIDNADNEADFIGSTSPIAKFVPQGREGTVIFTTRSRQVAIRQGCRVIRVGKMEPEEAQDLFSKRFDRWRSLEEEEKRDVARILDSMDHLPLAVLGSAAFMAENGTSPSVYWSIFRESGKRAKELLSEQFHDIQREIDMTESILSTYFITFDRITEQMPLMAKLLALIASLDRQNIPEELLTHSGLAGMDDSLIFCQAIGKLSRFSLVIKVKYEGIIFYELHRLVQLSIQAYLSVEQANQGRAAGLRAISRLFPEYEYTGRKVCAVYMSHALVLTKDSTDPIAESLVYRMGRHFIAMGSYNNAEIQVCQCLALREADKERERSGVDDSLIMLLAEVQWWQGRVKEAEEIYREALKDVENTSGLDHPDTFMVVHNLARVLGDQGRYEESEAMARRALQGYEKCFGSDHPYTLVAINNLAVVLRDRGRYEESELMSRRTLEGREKCFGSDHPKTLVAVNNLAGVLRDRGRYEESEVMNRRSLEGYEKCVGPDHPSTLLTVTNLALVLGGQGRYEESEVMIRGALEGYEKCFGPEYLNTLLAVNNLALVLRDQGRYEESEVMNRRALEGYEKYVGPDHPSALLAATNLALVLGNQGRYEESEVLNRRALEGFEKCFGSNHPYTLTAVHNLSRLFLKQGKPIESEILSRRVLEGREKALGTDHPSVLSTIDNLALALQAQGIYAEAEKLLQRALTTGERTLGLEHPNVCETLEHLACLHEKQEKYSQAEEAHERAYKGLSKALGEQHPTTLECSRRLKLLREQQSRPVRTSQVEVELGANVGSHRRSPGDRTFWWHKRLWRYLRKLWKRRSL